MCPPGVEPRFDRLQDWLDWQETLHAQRIALDPQRFMGVVRRMDLEQADARVLTIAGTNGKGSSVAYAEALLLEAGFSVGAYTSPHLLHYSERIRINGSEVSDEALMRAFHAIDQARGEVTLTYFEFATLAARWLFREAGVQAQILEVGMGGRLDAVNHFPSDVALITSVGLDHVEWLGADIEAIGYEKAGIFRSGRPAVFAGPRLPHRVAVQAEAIGARLAVAGRDFHSEAASATATGVWRYADAVGVLDGLLPPPIPGVVQRDNAAGVLRALRGFEGLRLDSDLWNRSLARVRMQGRGQRLMVAGCPWILDVAHNADSVDALARTLRESGQPAGRRLACLALMRRKDRQAVVQPLSGLVDGWYLPDRLDADAWPAAALAGTLAAGPAPVMVMDTLPVVVDSLIGQQRPGDEVIVFGSFRTVEEVLKALRARGVVEATDGEAGDGG